MTDDRQQRQERAYQRFVEACRATSFSLAEFVAAMDRMAETLGRTGDWHSVDEGGGATIDELLGDNQ
jgi:hypothetical protein